MQHMYEDTGAWLYFVPRYFPDFFFWKEVIMGIRIATLALCGLFVLPLILLILVQVKNFCHAKTTNERFSRKKVPEQNPSRQSSSSEDSLSGKLLEGEDDREMQRQSKRGVFSF